MPGFQFYIMGFSAECAAMHAHAATRVHPSSVGWAPKPFLGATPAV